MFNVHVEITLLQVLQERWLREPQSQKHLVLEFLQVLQLLHRS